ncbi:MAG: metal ABC transporter permease [Phycisphaeraceae bacterium]
MTWHTYDTWIVIIGALAAAACALPGCFLVLRRMSLMGDAIAHAVLPGIAIAFVLTQSRSSLPMFLGAVAVGILTAVLTQWIQKTGRVESQAALGIVFTSLFALGLIFMEQFAHAVHLDVDCVLYGAIEYAPLDTVSLAGTVALPRAAVVNGSMLLVNVAFLVLFYKELKISSFDPQLATTVGINANVMHYLLMGLVAATVVAAFESVGSILVIAMLIVPGAAAYLLTDRLGVMLLLAGLIAVASAVFGHAGAIMLPPLVGFPDTLTSGMMAVAAGTIFLVAMLAGPRHGVVVRMATQLGLGVRVAQQDLLALLYRIEETQAAKRQAGGAVVAPGLSAAEARALLALDPLRRVLTLTGLGRRGAVTRERARYSLTDAGRAEARDLVRSHRLWETYLDRFAAVRPDHLHLSAERLEHATDAAMQRELAQRTGSPEQDPQGRHIPD